MVTESKGLHDFHLRKRTHLLKQRFPHPSRWHRFVDDSIWVFGLLGPLLSVPQAWIIWSNKAAGDVSLISWLSFTVGSIFWLFYGFLHKEKPIIVTYCLFLVVNLFVVVGIVLYN